jgi:Transposase
MLFLGIDWGEHHHDLCLLDQDGMVLAVGRITDGLAGVGELHALVAAHDQDPAQVAVGIETDRGLLVGALLAAGYQVYAVNPHTVSRYRGRHGSSRAKSDRIDAKVLADLVRTDRHNHRQVAGDSPLAEAIKILARAHQNLVWSRQRHVNALRSALREFYPSALVALGAQLAQPWRCWSWPRPPSRAGGSPGQRCGGRWSVRAGAATCRRAWWPFTMRWRRRSWPRLRRSRRPTARWSAPWWPCWAA